MTENTNEPEARNKSAIENSMIIRYVNILLHYRKLIFITVFLIGLISAFIVFFMIKPVYYSSAIVKASGKSSGLSSLFSGGSIPDIGGLEELSGGSAGKELALYNQILVSRKCLEETIRKFDLMEVYDQKYMQYMLKEFRDKILDVTKDTKAGTMEIGVFDTSPERAREIAIFLIEQLNKINTELNVQNARNNREFIEGRYNIIKEELKQAEDSLRCYQDVYGMSPDIVAKSVVQTQVQIEAEIKSEEVKLDILKKILSDNQSEIKLQEEKIASLKKELENIRFSDDNNILNLKNTPVKVLNYLRLARNVEIKNKLLVYILPLFEQARIEEKKDMPSVLVLDQPEIPEMKKKPKRVIIIGLSLLISFVLLSSGLILYETSVKELLRSLKNKND
ncbi:MAG: Wzz/FepE/Etk N-terminal domain-containing protein [Ignavibacteria bacterium]|nr:Wzz/FepE/Etk N-terminal domain-containing protein [Ignavibacteria bacterium]